MPCGDVHHTLWCSARESKLFSFVCKILVGIRLFIFGLSDSYDRVRAVKMKHDQEKPILSEESDDPDEYVFLPLCEDLQSNDIEEFDACVLPTDCLVLICLFRAMIRIAMTGDMDDSAYTTSKRDTLCHGSRPSYPIPNYDVDIEMDLPRPHQLEEAIQIHYGDAVQSQNIPPKSY
eukprot:9230_1